MLSIFIFTVLYFLYSEYKYFGGGVILAWVVVLLVGDIAFHDDSDNK